jgi:hypothetical protein
MALEFLWNSKIEVSFGMVLSWSNVFLSCMFWGLALRFFSFNTTGQK